MGGGGLGRGEGRGGPSHEGGFLEYSTLHYGGPEVQLSNFGLYLVDCPPPPPFCPKMN